MKNIKSYIELLKANKNLVLTGAPGTGKTYLAKQIARAMRAKVEADIKADIDKCTHYVELLDELVKEQCDKEDAIEHVEEVHEEVVVEDEPAVEAAPIEEAENTAEPDTITVSEEGNQNATY